MMDSRQTNHAMISVIEKARGRRHTTAPSHLMSAALMAVFFIALMGALAAGARMYAAIVDAQEHSFDLHLQSGLIANIIRNNDYADAVRQKDGPEGPALVLARTLTSGTYEMRMYLYQGSVVQEFSAADQPLDPIGATPLLETSVFDFQIDDDLVTITCDGGSFCVNLRSDEGASATQATPAQQTAAPVTIIDEGGF